MEVFDSVFPNSSVSTPLIVISDPIVVSSIMSMDRFVFILRTLNDVWLFDDLCVVFPVKATSTMFSPNVMVVYM